LTHPTRLVFKPLGEVLLFCVHNYADVDIRDRAYFYYQLLTHVSSDRLRVRAAHTTHSTAHAHATRSVR
jgi:hypothetical protein